MSSSIYATIFEKGCNTVRRLIIFQFWYISSGEHLTQLNPITQQQTTNQTDNWRENPNERNKLNRQTFFQTNPSNLSYLGKKSCRWIWFELPVHRYNSKSAGVRIRTHLFLLRNYRPVRWQQVRWRSEAWADGPSIKRFHRFFFGTFVGKNRRRRSFEFHSNCELE